jgi:hypothetical protein
MPWFEIDGASIYDRLRTPKFHLIGFFDGRKEFPAASSNVAAEWQQFMDSTTISLYPNNAEIFGRNESFIVILRPDNYIGLISDDLSPDVISNYLNLVSR